MVGVKKTEKAIPAEINSALSERKILFICLRF
jgi:hypothetical protein